MSLKAYAVTTPERLSYYMDITLPTGTSYTVMEAMINSVTEFIEAYVGRRLKKTTYTKEVYDSESSETLLLKHFPVISSESFLLERRNSALNEDSWESVDSEYYFIDYDNGILTGAGETFYQSRGGYRVTYTAGYDFNNTSTFLSDTGGGDIELAAWMLLASLWNKKKGGAGVISEKIGDYSITYKKTLFEDPDIQMLLDKYTTADDIGVITPIQI